MGGKAGERKLSQFVDFVDEVYFTKIVNGEFLDFLLCICVCNSIVSIKSSSEISYQGASPDEVALVNFAAYSGFILQPESESSLIQIYDRNREVSY